MRCSRWPPLPKVTLTATAKISAKAVRFAHNPGNLRRRKRMPVGRRPVCPANANYYEVQCGWFNKKNDDKFCTSPLYRNKLCCDYTSDDCCVPHGGRIAWIVSCIVIITLSSIAGCYFSKSCCFQYRRAQSAPVVFMAPPPGVQMQQMGFPQQGYVQQGTYPQQGYVQQGTSPEQGQAPCQPVAAPPP